MIDRKEIELLIRAKLQKSNTLESVTKAVEELGKAIDAQAAAAKRGETSTESLVAAAKKLQGAQAELGQQADTIGAFLRATEAAGKLATRVDQAGKAYEGYRVKLAAASEITEKQQQRLANLAAAHERAQAAQARQQQQLATLAAALKAAGVATDDLAAAERRVREAATQIAIGLSKAREATEAHAQATNTLNRASSDLHPRVLTLDDALRSSGATLRGLVGNVVALAAAYAGLQGAIGLAGKSVEGFKAREGVKNQLALSVGNDAAAIDAEYAYVKAQAERIGIEFETAARGYAKFAAAAALAGRSRQEIRYIFEAFSEVGRVANLSREDLDGVFRALEQIISKGKIQAEELRGQLGDRLFGAFQVAAQALKDTYPDLDKALKDGAVTSEQLIKIAEKYRDIVGVQLTKATDSLAAKQARLTNAIADFRLVVADGGFADAFARLLERLTDYLRSTDGQDFARNVSAAFAAVADALVYVLKHLDEMKLGLTVIAGLWAAMKLRSVAGDFVTLGSAVRAAAADVGALDKAFVALGTFTAGFAIGTYLYDQFEIVRKAGAVLVVSYELAWSKIAYGAKIAFEQIPIFATNSVKALVNSITGGVRSILTVIADAARAIGRGDLAAGIDAAVSKLTLGYADVTTSRVAQLRREAEEDEKRIRAIGQDMLADAARAASKADGRPAPAEPTARPDIKPGKPSGPSDAEIAKRQREIDAITRALEILQAKIDRAQTDTLSKQLEAIDVEYQALARRVRKLGGEEAKRFLGELDSAVSQLKLQTAKKFNDKLLAEQETLQGKLEQVEAAAGRKSKTDLDARLQAIASSYAATYRDIEELRTKLAANNLSTTPADESKRRLDAAVLELQSLEKVKFLKEQLQTSEKGINDLLKSRELTIRAIENEYKAGNLTRGQADEQIRSAIASVQPQIDAATEAAREFAEANASAFDPLALQEFLIKMQEVKRSGAAMNAEFNRTELIVKQGIGSGIDSTFNAMYDALGRLIQRTGDWGDVFDAAGKSILNSLAQILKEIALTIIKEQILIQIQMIRIALGGGTPEGGAAGVITGGSGIKLHEGGIVGRGNNRRTPVTTVWFASAPRYHNGGFAGLAPDEVPAILQKNEEVLSKTDPRNALNGGSKVSTAQPSLSVRSVVVVDKSHIAEAMAGSEGETVIMQTIRRNMPTIRQQVKAR